MIIRKPYAFLIKNFKKIHIFLLVLGVFIYYKVMKTSSFVREFMQLGSYDSFNEPITKYVSFLAMFSLVIMVGLYIALIFLLKHKGKPWKLYLLPLIVYLGIMFTFSWTRSFFHSYDGSTETTNIRMIRDFLFILSFLQLPSLGVLVIRVFGIDLKKFDFKNDKEFLELSSEDRDEFEISIDIDKHSFVRLYKKLFRNISYVYLEHKLICNLVIVILFIMFARSTYNYIFVINKSYKQGQTLEANGYSITINNAYYTDKDGAGNIISKGKDKPKTKEDKGYNFIVIDLTIKNNIEKRSVDLNNFHIFNGVESFDNTAKLYEKEFSDFGKTFDSVQTIKRDESLDVIIIYRVYKYLSQKRFVLYYQEYNNNNPYLRKIKLNMEDVSTIKKHKELDMGDELKFEYLNKKEDIIFDSLSYVDNVEYSTKLCSSLDCSDTTKEYTAKANQKVLQIEFASSAFEGKDLIDFSMNYGKIKYKDSDGKTKTINVERAFSNKYYGKFLYIKVPKEVSTSKDVKLVYTLRNNRYTYKLVADKEEEEEE